jgi:hypothetical protein
VAADDLKNKFKGMMPLTEQERQALDDVDWVRAWPAFDGCHDVCAWCLLVK